MANTNTIKRSDNPRFTQDARKRWWYKAPNSPRKRAWVRRCPVCRGRFLSADTSKTCSHPCGAAFMHQQRPTTTHDVPAVALRNSDNPRFSKDANGQWWYTPGGPKMHARTRAHIKECARCGSPFLVAIYHRGARHCSRSCGLKASAEAHPDRFKGKHGGHWKGGRQVVRGYVWVWNPEAAQRMRPGTRKLYVLEHRLVMEQVLGRHLAPKENVHHKNGVRDDNRPENLELWVKHQPPGQRAEEHRHCPTCTCGAR